MSGRVHAEAKADPKSSFTPVRTGLLAGSREKQLVSQPPLIQAKSTINQPNDRYEQEADRVAEQVMRMPEPLVQRQVEPEDDEEETLQSKPLANQITPLVQRQTDPLEEEEETIQAKPLVGQTPEVTPAISSDIQSMRGGGGSLSMPERIFFEPRFGADFSNVLVHNDTHAASVAQSVNARAFTFGHNIVFGAGEYSSDSLAGKKLLAHELTHVVQQNGGPTLFSAGKNSENIISNSHELSIVSIEFTGKSESHTSIRRQAAPTTQLKPHPCVSKIGTCEFYECLSNMTPGDRGGGYYWNYGRKYCKRFNNSSLMNDPKGARWVDCVTLNLHRALLSQCVKHGSDLEKVEQCAYATHAKVYTDCGICELDKFFINQLKVMIIPDLSDLWTAVGRKQILESVGRCVSRPFVFQMIIDRFTSWGNLDEEALGKKLAESAKANSVGNYAVILGIIELLSNSFDDDDVAYEFTKALTNTELETLAKTSDGRRILFMMKHAMQGGWTGEDEQHQIDRIDNKSRR